MRRAPTLTPRQEHVVVMLYEQFGWSGKYIAQAAGCGRRVIENALHRHGVKMRRKGRRVEEDRPLNLPFDTARAWFADAARPERAELDEPTCPTIEVEGTIVFRRRRCQHCGTLTHYAADCPTCHRPLDWSRQEEREAEALQNLRLEEEHRGRRREQIN